jgi:hypothetical protein
MTFTITEDLRRNVVQLWLNGKSRNDIAIICGVSGGTVSNIIDEWKHRLGIHDAEAIRILAINLKRLGIDAAQCAEGFRILRSMKKLGVNENQFESFIHEVYEYCQRYGLTSKNIASNLNELIKLSKDIPFVKIPDHIEEKKNEITKLEEVIKTLKGKKEKLETEVSLAEELRDTALKNEKTTVAELREYSKFKTELGKYGLTVDDDTRKLVQVIYGIKQRNEYDVGKILSEYSDIEFMQDKRDMLSNLVRTLEDKIVYLQGQCSFLESQVNLHNQRLYVYDELKSMGLGIRELKIILNAIKEIAAENNIDPLTARDNFIEFLEKKYDIKLRAKIQEQQQQNQKMQRSRSFVYRKSTTAFPNTSEEQNDQLDDDNNSDERYGSGDDHLL